MLVEKLVDRIIESRAKNRLEDFLKAAKEKNAAPVRAFATAGSRDQLVKALDSAIQGGFITLREVVSLMDRIEENGAHHIFMFDLTKSGHAALTEKALRGAFKLLPDPPPEDMYSEVPAKPYTFLRIRDPIIALKQVRQTMYMMLDPKKTVTLPSGEQTITRVPVERRAVNMLIINVKTGAVEIRIDRSDSTSDATAIEDFDRFVTDMKDSLKWKEHLDPFPIRSSFPKMVDSRDIFMKAAQVVGSDLAGTVASVRELTDVRDAKRYNFSPVDDRWDIVKAYFSPPKEESDPELYAVVNPVDIHGIECAKVYISARVEPEELSGVIARIRNFAA